MASIIMKTCYVTPEHFLLLALYTLIVLLGRTNYVTTSIILDVTEVFGEVNSNIASLAEKKSFEIFLSSCYSKGLENTIYFETDLWKKNVIEQVERIVALLQQNHKCANKKKLLLSIRYNYTNLNDDATEYLENVMHYVEKLVEQDRVVVDVNFEYTDLECDELKDRAKAKSTTNTLPQHVHAVDSNLTYVVALARSYLTASQDTTRMIKIGHTLEDACIKYDLTIDVNFGIIKKSRYWMPQTIESYYSFSKYLQNHYEGKLSLKKYFRVPLIHDFRQKHYLKQFSNSCEYNDSCTDPYTFNSTETSQFSKTNWRHRRNKYRALFLHYLQKLYQGTYRSDESSIIEYSFDKRVSNTKDKLDLFSSSDEWRIISPFYLSDNVEVSNNSEAKFCDGEKFKNVAVFLNRESMNIVHDTNRKFWDLTSSSCIPHIKSIWLTYVAEEFQRDIDYVRTLPPANQSIDITFIVPAEQFEQATTIRNVTLVCLVPPFMSNVYDKLDDCLQHSTAPAPNNSCKAIRIAKYIVNNCFVNGTNTIIAIEKELPPGYVYYHEPLLTESETEYDMYEYVNELLKSHGSEHTVMLYVASTSTHNKLFHKPPLERCEINNRRFSWLESMIIWARIQRFGLVLTSSAVIYYHRDIVVSKHEHQPYYPFPVPHIFQPEPSNVLPWYFSKRTKASTTYANQLTGLYKCERAAENGEKISFDHGVTGITLRTNIRQLYLHPQEMKTVLLFTCGTFRVLDIILEDYEDTQTLLQVIYDPDFPLLLQTNTAKCKSVYLQINSLSLDFDTTFKVLLRMKQLWSAVHLTLQTELLQTKSSLDIWNFCKEVSNSNITLGITYKNSILDEMKKVRTLAKILSTSKQNGIQLIYLVCEDQTSFVDIEEETSSYDDFNPFIKSRASLQNNFPMLKVIYRMLPKISTMTTFNETGKYVLTYLRFFSKFGKRFQVDFFLLPAFSKVNDINDKVGWWHITNYSDLSDTTAYVDYESVMLNKTIWRPRVLKKEVKPQAIQNYVFLLLMAAGFIVILLCISIAVLTFILRTKYKLLSRVEVCKFRQGQDTLKNAASNKHLHSLDSHNFIPFKEEHELPVHAIHLDRINVLGKGQFGIVYRGKFTEMKYHVDGASELAVKMPHKNCSKEIFMGMLSEVKLLSYIGHHPNVVTFVGAYTKKIDRGELWIATELCIGGSLLNHLQINNEQESFSMDTLIGYARGIACGMNYIASKNVVHGDLSARNVLLDEHNICRIADFGLSKKLYDSPVYVKKGQEALPWRWMAPEVLKFMTFSVKSDVWSYGVTLWEVFNLGAMPYPGLTWSAEFTQDIENGMLLKQPKRCDNNTFTLISSCWKIEAEERPSFQELCDQLSYLSDYVEILGDD